MAFSASLVIFFAKSPCIQPISVKNNNSKKTSSKKTTGKPINMQMSPPNSMTLTLSSYSKNKSSKNLTSSKSSMKKSSPGSSKKSGLVGELENIPVGSSQLDRIVSDIMKAGNQSLTQEKSGAKGRQKKSSTSSTSPANLETSLDMLRQAVSHVENEPNEGELVRVKSEPR